MISTNAKELAQVKEYYGKILSSTRDLRSSACCSTDSLPDAQRRALALIEPEILDRFYGCGSPIPPALEGCVVLDLGCGTGRDTYIASQLVGPQGRCIGVDMTEEQLEVAERLRDRQMARFGYDRPNVSFHQGYIEDLRDVGIEDDSVDVVISNCVINLSPDKDRVFSEIRRVLKPGGELFFADVFSGRRVPESVRKDPVLYGECLGGAMYIEDFRRALFRAGFADYRVLSRSRIEITDADLSAKVGMIDFSSLTIRAFKLESLEDRCEDYGQVAIYRGTIAESPHAFVLDDHHTFITGKPMLVCGNTAAMVEETRFGRHFLVHGDRSTHYGEFACAPATEKLQAGGGVGGACC